MKLLQRASVWWTVLWQSLSKTSIPQRLLLLGTSQGGIASSYTVHTHTHTINFLLVVAVLYPVAMPPPRQFHPTAAHFLPFPMFKVRESLNWNRKCNKYSLNSTDFQTPAVYNLYSPLYHQKAERIKQSLEAVVNWHLIARNPDLQSHR